MGLEERATVLGVPRLDTVVEAPLDPGPEALEPEGVAADAPLAVDLHDAAQLSIRGGVEVVIRRADGEARAERLVATRILVDEELRVAQRPLEVREEVRQRLGVVPDVGARAVAAAVGIAATLPTPELAVGLALHGGRLEDREVGRDGLDDLGGEGRVVEGPGEALRPCLESVILRAPVGRDRLDIGEDAGIPGRVLPPARAGATARRLVGVLSQAQVGHGRVPGKAQRDDLGLAGLQIDRDVEAAAEAGRALCVGCPFDQRSFLYRLPEDC